jgi:tetratricopeptide (TPR) repeat protein
MSVRSVLLFVALAIAFAVGPAVGVAATSDPRQKLQEAELLFETKNRPLRAEVLIQEAIQALQQGQDWQWLGHGYREYGDLLTSEAVARLERVYRRDGFRDRSITFDNRHARAADFYRMALESYQRAESANLLAPQYDALTNLYFNMGLSSHQLGQDEAACTYYLKMVEAADRNRALNPSIAPPAEKIEAVVAAYRKASGCAVPSSN